MRSWTDDRHAALKHVKKLREFIQRRAPDEGANLGHARIVFCGLLKFVRCLSDSHRAKLVNLDDFPVPAVALLLVNNGSTRFQANGEGNERHNG